MEQASYLMEKKLFGYPHNCRTNGHILTARFIQDPVEGETIVFSPIAAAFIVPFYTVS